MSNQEKERKNVVCSEKLPKLLPESMMSLLFSLFNEKQNNQKK